MAAGRGTAPLVARARTWRKELTMKYYIRRTVYDGYHPPLVAYKRCKCVDGFSPDKSVCWRFSKQGASGIIKALNEEFKRYVDEGRMSFDMIPAEEVTLCHS